MSPDASPSEPQVLDFGSLPSVEDYGFQGGRQSLRTFCSRVFAPDGPRFLRTANGSLAVFRHADVRALGAEPNLSALAPAVLFPGMFDGQDAAAERPGYAFADLIKNQLFTSNPPLNPLLRRVMLNQVGPKPMAAEGQRTRAIAQDILQAMPLGAPVDLVRQVCEPLVGRFWGGLLQMSDDEAAAAAVEARRMSPMLDLRPDREARASANVAAEAYRALVEGAGERALANGGCPFVQGIASDLSGVDMQDDLDHLGYVPKTAGAFLAGNLFDGFHTAVLAAVNTLYVLLRRPEALEEVRRSPEKAGAAVAESLRLESPVIQLNRITTGEIRYQDVIIPKGVLVSMMWGAANHDPAGFADPERFDLDRSQQGATMFGGGAHICPGRFAALVIARSLLETVIEMGLEVAIAPGEEQWIENNAMSQLAHLPVVLTSRSAG